MNVVYLNIEGIKSNKKFWNENSEKLPRLRFLYICMQNIPATSAFIERYFSFAGIVCKKNAGSMSGVSNPYYWVFMGMGMGE